jgi:hypothetical protein
MHEKKTRFLVTPGVPLATALVLRGKFLLKTSYLLCMLFIDSQTATIVNVYMSSYNDCSVMPNASKSIKIPN